MSSDSTRAHYRVVFPVAAGARFREFCAAADHIVIDCCETGLHYLSAQPPEPPVGAEVEGTIIFPDGEETRVAGRVVWTSQGEVALHLSVQSIPFTRIVQQQRYLRHEWVTR
jgi:hypothetical protein